MLNPPHYYRQIHRDVDMGAVTMRLFRETLHRNMSLTDEIRDEKFSHRKQKLPKFVNKLNKHPAR